jgi:uncharacterized protein YodC (DUF2158 family)
VDEDNPLEMGDTVRLKFGGPLMTILSISGDDCCCMWFGEGARLEHGSFELEVLELVERAVRLVDTRQPARPGARRGPADRHA